MPKTGGVSNYAESNNRRTDMLMFAMFDACDRSLEEWKALFHECAPALRILQHKQPPGAGTGILEVVYP